MEETKIGQKDVVIKLSNVMRLAQPPNRGDMMQHQSVNRLMNSPLTFH